MRVDRSYAAAALLCVGALVETLSGSIPAGQNPVFAPLLAVAATLPVARARAQPVAATILVTTAVLLLPIGGVRPPVAGLVALAAVFYLTGRYRSRQATALLATPFLGYAAASLPAGGDRPIGVLLLGLALVAGIAGVAVRAREEAARRAAADRAVADTLLEHAARGERARIARELHDVVAHHISMIAVQAEAARLTTPGMPPQGAKRLVAIGDTARTALTEMRRLLGVLREDAGDEPTRRPQPGLTQLNDLLDEVRSVSASSTRLIVRGAVAPLDPGIELTAYRIVQEALTNTRRHAPGAALDVELDYRPDALYLRIRDNGPGPPDGVNGAGHGLTGMRERAAMVGGRLSAGPAPHGGFLVEATLPMPEAER